MRSSEKMKSFSKILFISSATLIFLSFLPCQLRGSPTVSLSLDQDIFTLDKPFLCTLTVSWEGDADLYLFAPPHLTLPEGIEEESSSFSSISTGTRYSLHYKYNLNAMKKGDYVLNPIEISYWKKGTNKEEKIKTGELHFQVASFGFQSPGRYWLWVTLAFIFLGLFVIVIVLNKNKKRAGDDQRSETAITSEMMMSELEQCNTYKIKGEWGNYLQKVISIRDKLPLQDEGGNSIDHLDSLAEKVTYGGLRPTTEEINLIQRQLEKALKHAFPDDKDKELEGIKFR
jgi:hypothetical protein